MNFTVGFALGNLVTQKIFVEFRASQIFHDFRGNEHLVTLRNVIFTRISRFRK